MPVEEHIIRERAKEFTKEPNIQDFKATKGWSAWWKKGTKISGEERSCTAD